MRPRDALDRPTDLVIAELAAVQHGRVASWQLALAGVTPTELRRRAQAGRLHREFRGVYAVGTPVVAGRPYEANVLLSTPFGELRVDAYWREYGFGVELDSQRHHGDRDAFERDRERVIAADLIGLDLKRVTWRMLVGTRDVVAALLDRRLPRRAAAPRPAGRGAGGGRSSASR